MTDRESAIQELEAFQRRLEDPRIEAVWWSGFPRLHDEVGRMLKDLRLVNNLDMDIDLDRLALKVAAMTDAVHEVAQRHGRPCPLCGTPTTTLN